MERNNKKNQVAAFWEELLASEGLEAELVDDNLVLQGDALDVLDPKAAKERDIRAIIEADGDSHYNRQ